MDSKGLFVVEFKVNKILFHYELVINPLKVGFMKRNTLHEGNIFCSFIITQIILVKGNGIIRKLIVSFLFEYYSRVS